MTDIEGRVSDTLTRRVQRPIDVERLRTNALRRATAIRRRRLAIGTVTAMAAVMASVMASVMGAVLGATGLLKSPSVTSPAVTLPLETAAARGMVGSDPGLLHFDVDLAVFEGLAASTEWVSGIGYEALHIYRDDDQRWVDVTLDPTESSRTTRLEAKLGSPLPDTGRHLVIGGRPAQLQEITYQSDTAWLLRWQPALDAFGSVIVTSQDDQLAVRVAHAVRMDRVLRCVMPLRLTELPAHTRWHECQTRIRSSQPGWIYSGLTLERDDGKPILIWADGRRGADHAASFKPDQTIGRYQAQWLTGGSAGTGLWIPDFGPIDLYITTVNPHDSDWLTQDDARWLAQRLQPSQNTGDPATWPRRAAG